jgi:hypothetical protein
MLLYVSIGYIYADYIVAALPLVLFNVEAIDAPAGIIVAITVVGCC